MPDKYCIKGTQSFQKFQFYNLFLAKQFSLAIIQANLEWDQTSVQEKGLL